ncbi:MAG: Na+/H+ antiporter NhaC [Bacillota bacterium]|nr:Na+/H+ antiporter NhaC [Bacillota bacterium]
MKKNNLIINPLVVLIISTVFIICCIVLSVPLYMGFILGIIFTFIVLFKSGFELKLLMNTIFSALKQVKHLSIIILMIGATTSIWLSSGVVQTIMYYGFEQIKGINFLVAAFLIMVAVSVFMGTAVGTISTVGISLLGIGKGLDIPVEIVVGVLVSGGFIADKISPLSGLVNLIMSTVNINYKQYVKGLLITLIPTIIITAIIYYFIGKNYTFSDYSQLEFYKTEISKVFNTSPILLILPLTIIVLSVFGLNSVLTIFIGVILGSTLSIIFQHMDLVEVLKAMVYGYHGNTASPELNEMLNSGGMLSMIEVILVVVSGVVLVKLFETGNILLPLMDKLLNKVKTKISLILRTMLVSSLLTIITCDQTTGIILPGSVMQEKYKEFNLDNTVLARIISDSGTIIAPLMAWNVNAFIITPILGVSANDYALFAVLCYICPIITIIVSYLLYNNKYSMSK